MIGQIEHDSLLRCYEEEYELLFDFIDDLPDNRIIEQIYDILLSIIRSNDIIETTESVIETHRCKISTYPNLKDIKHLCAINDDERFSVSLLDDGMLVIKGEHASFCPWDKMYSKELYEKIYLNNKIIFQSSTFFWFGPKLWKDDTNVCVEKYYLIDNKNMLIEDLTIWADKRMSVEYYASDYYVTDYVRTIHKKEKISEDKFKKESKEILKHISEIYSNYDLFNSERAEYFQAELELHMQKRDEVK